MSRELLQRLSGTFVERGPVVTDHAHAYRHGIPAPPSVAVLCDIGTGLACGAAVALALRRGAHCPAALVLHWSASPSREVSPRVPGFPGAHRLVRSLRGRGHRAWGSGRLAFVALPDDPGEAAAAAGRAGGVAGAAPCVLVVAGPRPAAVETLLALQDGVAVVAPDGGDGDLAALALAGLADRGLSTCVLDLPVSGVSRAGAVTGLWIPGRARRAVGKALGGPA
ncbi:MAG: hypothetical protein QOI98_155 [Solirubrobacteraceae bacterium]|nr:hypothetical protein [Solirubrobacteraceae bacterium]